jgi:hypothetical protein
VRIGLVVIMAFALNGCSVVGTTGVGTAGLSTGVSGMTPENLPVREVGVIIVSQDLKSVAAIQELINRSSGKLLEAVGIRLLIKDWKLINWSTASRDGRLDQLVGTMRDYDKPYDIVIAFCNREPLEALTYVAAGGWQGVIDNAYRRFIVVRSHDIKVLLHEIVHAFVFDVEHAGGVMAGTDICFFPNVLCFNRTESIHPRAREEVLKNKWRDFSVRPGLPRVSAH